jgi:hypothetical protein
MSELLRKHWEHLPSDVDAIIFLGSSENNTTAYTYITEHLGQSESPELTCLQLSETETDQDRDRFQQLIREHANAYSNPAFFLTDAGRELLRAHDLTAPVKRNGAIVVSCLHRPLFTSKPGNTAGATYPGMFDRAGKLAAETREFHDAPGDYMEFGVFDGRTISLAWHSFGEIPDMRFFAFDSFEGIIGSLDQEVRYPDATYMSNLPTFYHNMRVAQVQRVTAIQGDFLSTLSPQLLAEHDVRRCYIAHIDCDVYRPAKAALTFLSHCLVQGSVLLFDEYNGQGCSNQLGERRALREFLQENPQFDVERWHDYATAASPVYS